MLKYIEETTLENAKSEALQSIHRTVEAVRLDEEVGISRAIYGKNVITDAILNQKTRRRI